MKIHHFGYLTTSIENSFKEFSQLGYTKVDKLYLDENRGIKIQFIRSVSGELIELIESASDKSVVNGLLPNATNKIYHICYYTSDMEKSIKNLEKRGFFLISAPQPAVALNNSNVAFLLSKYAGIIELYEDSIAK